MDVVPPPVSTCYRQETGCLLDSNPSHLKKAYLAETWLGWRDSNPNRQLYEDYPRDLRPETKEVRDLLRATVARTLDLMWHQDQKQNLDIEQTAVGGEIVNKIQALPPQNDAQRAVQAQASGLAVDLGKLRWLMLEQESTSISIPLLAVLFFGSP